MKPRDNRVYIYVHSTEIKMNSFINSYIKMNYIFCTICILFEPGSKFHLIETTSAIFIPWDDFHSVVIYNAPILFNIIIFYTLNCVYKKYHFKFISIIILSLECWRIFFAKILIIKQCTAILRNSTLVWKGK